MTEKQRASIWAALVVVVIVALGAVFIIRQLYPAKRPISLTGVALVDDPDPQKQSPIAYARVVASLDSPNLKTASFQTRADAFGLFHLNIPDVGTPASQVVLNLSGVGYQPRQVTVSNAEQVQIVRLLPAAPVSKVSPAAAQAMSTVSNLRVRYSEKAAITTNVGSAMKIFEVVNTGNIPCRAETVCSPDRKWKAAIGSTTLEGQGGEFRNVRLSCIAGPCPFTRIESETPVDNGSNLKVSVRNWSDTTTFLLEAEVSQTRTIEVVRESFPARFGSSMNFTLPATAQGPSIEADMNGHPIVYPLGPDLILSWAVCSVKISAEHTKLFRCDLKAGYQFK